VTPSEKECYRLFVAISVTPEVKNAILGAQTEIRRNLPGEGISWTRPEQFHLTLKFLGDVPADSVPALIDALCEATAGIGTLALHARGLGFFPNARAPRVLWAGVTDGSERLGYLQPKVEEACRSFSAETAESRFHAHITLARVKRFQGRAAAGLQKAVVPYQDQDFGSWPAAQIELMRSQLSNAGPSYSTLAHLPLGSSA
jgi:RNA 2',3'-cyclic 3'-phosphodiesterase